MQNLVNNDFKLFEKINRTDGIMKVIKNGFAWHLSGIAIWLLMLSCAAYGAPNYALFEPGREIDVLNTNVGSAGASLQVGEIGSPVDGVNVEIPKGALSETVSIRLFYNTGKFMPISGKPSGVVFGISAGSVKQFQNMLKIRVRYDAQRYAGNALVGFSIDPDGSGRVSGFQLLSQDEKAGTVMFGTLVPVQFTWIYVPVQLK